MFVSFIKHVLFKLIRYLFLNQIYEKSREIESVHVCLVLKTCVPLLLYEVGPEIWKIYCFFRRKNHEQFSVEFVLL